MRSHILLTLYWRKTQSGKETTWIRNWSNSLSSFLSFSLDGQFSSCWLALNNFFLVWSAARNQIPWEGDWGAKETIERLRLRLSQRDSDLALTCPVLFFTLLTTVSMELMSVRYGWGQQSSGIVTLNSELITLNSEATASAGPRSSKVELLICNQRVGGSNPSVGSTTL